MRNLRTSFPLREAEEQEPLPAASGPSGEREPSAKVKKIADEICGLTMLEVADLTKYLKVTAALRIADHTNEPSTHVR